MNRIFDQSNPVMRAMGKLFDIGWLSILWLLCSIPVFTIGASTTALYYTTVKVLRRERGYVSTEFFHSFRQSFISATILWLGFLLLYGLLAFNIRVTASDTLIGIYLALGILVTGVLCYVFPVLSRFELKLTKILKLCFYMSCRHVLFTLGFLILLIGSGVLLFFTLSFPIILLVLPAGVTWIYSFLMEHLMKKYMPKEEKKVLDDGEEVTSWYNEL